MLAGTAINLPLLSANTYVFDTPSYLILSSSSSREQVLNLATRINQFVQRLNVLGLKASVQLQKELMMNSHDYLPTIKN